MKDCNLPKPSNRHRVMQQDGAYVVIDPDGHCVFGPGYKSLAEKKCDALQAAADGNGRTRACMCCRTEFHSEGFHNRLCARCRGSADPMAGTGFAGSQDGRKPRRAAGV